MISIFKSKANNSALENLSGAMAVLFGNLTTILAVFYTVYPSFFNAVLIVNSYIFYLIAITPLLWKTSDIVENKKLRVLSVIFTGHFLYITVLHSLPTLLLFITLLKIQSSKERKISSLICLKLLKITEFVYSKKTYKEVFVVIVGDWLEEYFEAIDSKEMWKARWINVRYTYAFILAMIQKSPIGDIFEFIMKIALKVAK